MIKSLSRLPIAVAILAVCFAVTAHASTVGTISDVTGTPNIVFGVTSFSVTGADMVGLRVTVNFSDATSSGVVIWAANCGGNCGSASGAVPGGGTWTLTQTGTTGSVSNTSSPDTTADNYWTLTNTSTVTAITSVELLGGDVQGGVVFDRDRVTGGGAPSGGQVGTPGSAFGITFATTTTSKKNPPPADTGPNAQYTVNVTYSNIVQLLSAPQTCLGTAFSGNNTGTGCGDLWQGLTFAFSPSTAFVGAVGNAATLNFFTDTDQIGVPEPLTMGLMGLGLLAIAAYRKRVAKSAD